MCRRRNNDYSTENIMNLIDKFYQKNREVGEKPNPRFDMMLSRCFIAMGVEHVRHMKGGEM